MKMVHRITLAFLCLITITSCRKRNENPGTVNDYTQLKAGNYWIYQTYNIGDSSVFQAPLRQDSVYVEKDTVIGSYTYHKLSVNEGSEISYLRDSLDYLVNAKGQIIMSANNFESILFSQYLVLPGAGRNDSIGLYTCQMTDRYQITGVPAGNFVTIAMKETIVLHPENVLNGQTTRVMHTRYANGIGKISEVLPPYLSNPGYTERRLIQYKVIK